MVYDEPVDYSCGDFLWLDTKIYVMNAIFFMFNFLSLLFRFLCFCTFVLYAYLPDVILNVNP